jgi:hypothetical protein
MYKEMLKEDVERSKEFTTANFGLMVGDEFPEMAKELMAMDEIGSKLVFRTIVAALAASDIAKDLPEPGDGSPDWARIISKHMTAFELPLSLFYWGVQIGRRQAREMEVHS